MNIDTDNPVVRLCLAGTQAEFEGRTHDAKELYRLAWEQATDDFEACISAHYVARHQESPEDRLHWNQVALDRACADADDRVSTFFPSLYLNLGRSHELLNNQEEARRYYALAAELGVLHQPK